MRLINVYQKDGKIVKAYSGASSIITESDFRPYLLIDGSIKSAPFLGHGCLLEATKRSGREFAKIYGNHPRDIPDIRKWCYNYGIEPFEYDVLFHRRFLLDEYKKNQVDYNNSDNRIISLDIEVITGDNANRMPRLENRGDKIIIIDIYDGTIHHTFSGDDEESLLQDFNDYLSSQSAHFDVIVTFNGDGFDWPYLAGRMRGYSIKPSIDIVLLERNTIYGKTTDAITFPIGHVDMLCVAKKIFRLKHYTLGDVAEQIGESKVAALNAKEISEKWKTKDGQEFLEEYCRKDAEITHRLAKLFIGPYLSLAQLINLPIQDVIRMTSGQIVEHYLMVESIKRGLFIPNKPEKSSPIDDVKYKGATVFEPMVGLYDNVTIYDFKMMYPNIIVKHNIDPGIGILPEIVGMLIKWRQEMKDKIAVYKKLDNVVATLLYEQDEQSLRILLNSFYGYMGYPGARWFNKEAAESVTKYAREYINRLHSLARQNGLKVIYGDTDSLFIIGSPTMKLAFESNIKDDLELSKFQIMNDGDYKRGLFLTKKRYVLWDGQKMDYKGIEIVRRDWSPMTQKMLREILDEIIIRHDVDGAVKIVLCWINRVKQGKVVKEDYILSKQLSKFPSAYRGKQPHVVIAQKNKLDIGTRVEYIIQCGEGLVSELAVPPESISLDDVNVDYYIERQLIKPALRILESFGVDKYQLLTGKKQMRLL